MFPTDISPIKITKDKTIFSDLVQPSQESKDTSARKSTGRWTKEEHHRFVEGLKNFGKNWKKIEEHVGTRSGPQIRSHAQKFFIKLEREVGIGGKNPVDVLNFEDTPKGSRKASDCSNTTSCSYQESLPEQTNSLKRTFEAHQKLDLMSNTTNLIERFPLHLYMPILNHCYGLQNTQPKPRRMSMDAFPVQASSNQLLEAMLPMRTSINNDLTHLSNLINLTSNRNFPFSSFVSPAPTLNLQIGQVYSFNNTLNANFGMRPTPTYFTKPRKYSEDNVLIQNNVSPAFPLASQFKPEEYEILTKKLKQF